MPFSIDPTVYSGRPASPEGRIPQEVACYDLLDGLSIPYSRVDHDPAATIALCHQVEQVLEAPICKNLFLCNRQQTAFYLLLMDGDKVFKTKHLSRQLGVARLSFAGEDALEHCLRLTPGSASVLGLMNDHAHQVQLVIDRPLRNWPYLGCHPCINTSTLRLNMQDVLDRLLPALGVQPAIVDLPLEGEP